MHLPPKTPPFFMKDNPYYQRERKVMVLLHGYTGDATDWLYNSAAADLSMRYNLAIVMPNGGISFYLDRKSTGRQYAKFIGEELIDYLRETFGLAMTKEDTLIGGVSMGGFGALHTGLA
jgi:S-formylglutathione hydrolase FrmB